MHGDDHVTTFSESKKGQELGLYIKTVPNMTPIEVGLRFDIWQENMTSGHSGFICSSLLTLSKYCQVFRVNNFQ